VFSFGYSYREGRVWADTTRKCAAVPQAVLGPSKKICRAMPTRQNVRRMPRSLNMMWHETREGQAVPARPDPSPYSTDDESDRQ
jgi:hypothetical protein